MTSRIVHLGFEVSGINNFSPAAVQIPVRHMAVTGQTQESGKTTALTALISRAQLPAIAFLTKRGEGSMEGRKVLPFFQERADWQFVQSILESTMKERMKFERAWIVRACQGTKTLGDVQRNIIKLEGSAKNALSKDVYMLLGEYLKRVVPMISKLPKGFSIWEEFAGLQSGLRVMDLIAYPEELQMLVIASTLDWIHKHAKGVIAIIPEAWKFIPQSRNTPVKISAEKLAREGAALRNYLWIDSQDMAGVDKMLLRQCAVWLIGVQREPNEIKRALASIPAGFKKPKAEDVATLELGQFFACFGKEIRKTYVQPAWMDETVASQIASGRLSVHDLQHKVAERCEVVAHNRLQASVPELNGSRSPEHTGVLDSGMPSRLGIEASQHSTEAKEPDDRATRPGQVAGAFPLGSEDEVSPRSPSELQTFAKEEGEAMADEKLLGAIRAAIIHLKLGSSTRAAEVLEAALGESPDPVKAVQNGAREYSAQESLDNEQLYQAFKSRLLKEAPALIKLIAEEPHIELKIIRTTVNMGTDSLDGNVARLIHDGFFDSPRGNSETIAELNRRGWKTIAPRMSDSFTRFNKMGLLYKEDDKYRAVGEAKKRIVAA